MVLLFLKSSYETTWLPNTFNLINDQFLKVKGIFNSFFLVAYSSNYTLQIVIVIWQ